MAAPTLVSLTCKAFINAGLCSFKVQGLPILEAALRHERRNHGQGVITVANHISTLDDPMMWGALPLQYHINSRTTRWALGASELLFTNPLFSAFFRSGQVLETFRGKGIYQPAVDQAIEKLNSGSWVHLFPEGGIAQPENYVCKAGIAELRRFKWGIGRMVMETSKVPVIIPMWLSGFERLMPEGREGVFKYIPQPGAKLTVTFGEPIPSENIHNALAAMDPSATERSLKADKVRSDLTSIVQRAVESLGRDVSGDLLGSKGVEKGSQTP